MPPSSEFINREGLPEAGIDGGGLLKEFVDSVVREAFSPRLALFCSTPGGSDDYVAAALSREEPHRPMLRTDNRLFPNPRCREAGHLAHFTFLGRLL